MEEERTNLVPRLQQDAYMHALNAAQPGVLYPGFTGGITGNGHNAVSTISEDHSLGPPVPTSFEDDQIGDLTNLDRSLFAEKNVSHVDKSHYSAYESLATTGNGAYESLATPDNGVYALATPGSGVFESLATTGNGAYESFVAAGNGAFESLATPGSGTYANSNNHIFAPFVNTNPSRLTESTVAADVAYNDGIALPPAPNPYIWVPTVAEGPMDEYTGANFQYPNPSLPMMSPFAADTNGNGYQGQFPANSFDNQWGAAVEFPNAFHAVATNATPFDIGPPIPPRPTCTECNQTFGRKADLDRHARIHQADSNVFQCQVEGCKYSNYRKDKLDEHVKRRHQALGTASTQF